MTDLKQIAPVYGISKNATGSGFEFCAPEQASLCVKMESVLVAVWRDYLSIESAFQWGRIKVGGRPFGTIPPWA